MAKEKSENPNAHDRDHSDFPEIVDRFTGQVMTAADIALVTSREGRRLVGIEYPNPVPVAPPVGYVPTPDMWELLRDMVTRHKRAQDLGEFDPETEEEANDFEVGDDFDPNSPWEEMFHPQEPWSQAVSSAAEELGTAIKRARQEEVIQEAKKILADRGGGGAEPPGGQPKREAQPPQREVHPASGDPPAHAKPSQ